MTADAKLATRVKVSIANACPSEIRARHPEHDPGFECHQAMQPAIADARTIIRRWSLRARTRSCLAAARANAAALDSVDRWAGEGRGRRLGGRVGRIARPEQQGAGADRDKRAHCGERQERPAPRGRQRQREHGDQSGNADNERGEDNVCEALECDRRRRGCRIDFAAEQDDLERFAGHTPYRHVADGFRSETDAEQSRKGKP